MQAGKHVLITGASIAGPALAYWLRRYGMKVTVVERHGRLRDGGQSVDLRGAGKKVIQLMGVADEIRKHTTNETAWTFVDKNNQTIASFGASAYGGEGPTAELEILRGELAKVLVGHTSGEVAYRFDDWIDHLDQSADKVRVRFNKGSSEEFDVVVAAEGIGSSTRGLLWGDEVRRRSFGLMIAYFTIPRSAADGTVARWFNPGGGRSVFLRPDNLGTTRVGLNLRDPPVGLEKRPLQEQKDVLTAKFADAGWETPRVLRGLRATTDFYSESVGQVLLDHWSKGRVVLLGDAAYCASPISGMGTSLSIVGAYILAGELAKNSDPVQALQTYEQLMRPYVEKAQDVPSFAPKLAQPKTTLGLAAQRLILRVAASRLARKITKNRSFTPADQIELPDYSAFYA